MHTRTAITTPAPSTISKRNLSIDLIKTSAMLMVIGLHTCQPFQSGFFSLGSVVYRTSVLAIPLFFMVSGYLLLGRSEERSGYRYALGKVGRILRLIAICTVIYTLWAWWSGSFGPDAQVSWWFFIRSFAASIRDSFYCRNKLFFLWFLWALVIIYLLYPCLNKLYLNRPGIFKGITALCAVTMTVLFGFEISRIFTVHSVITPLRICEWVFYFMAGGMSHHIPRVCSTKALWMACAALFILNLLQQSLLMPAMGTVYCDPFYTSPLTMIYVICVFRAFCRLRIQSSRWLMMLSPLFLPVYLIHSCTISWICGWPSSLWLSENLPMVYPLVFWATTAGTSILISFVIMRIPLIKRILTL